MHTPCPSSHQKQEDISIKCLPTEPGEGSLCSEAQLNKYEQDQVVITWVEPPNSADRHDWKHYHPVTSLAGGKNRKAMSLSLAFFSLSVNEP